MVFLLSNRRAANIRATAALCCFATFSLSLPAAADEPGQILSIATGHSLILHGHGITKVAIGDGKIAAAIPLDSGKLLVNPKSAGTTTVFFWDAEGQHTYELTVTDDRLDRVVGILRSSIDSPEVSVSALGTTIFVNGKVSDIAEYQRIGAAIAQYQGIKFDGVTTTIVNGVEVRKPFGPLQDELAKIPGSSGLRVDVDPTGNVVVSGRVPNKQKAQTVLDRVSGLAGPYLKTDGKVIDRLALDAKSQINIRVDVLEVDRTATSQLGLRLQTAQESTVGGQFTIGSTQSISALENPAKITGSSNPFEVGPFSRVSLLAPTIDLLLQEGHARELSSPNLITMPGKAATFLVGGQIPVPVSNGLGTISVTFEQYGVQLNVTPTIEADGGIESVITPEISDLDFADGIQLNGFTIPALKTSKISTDVITETGESIILGGLLRRVESKTIQKIPLLADLPILGQLFRSTSYQKTDSDVVFVLTPTIITRPHGLPVADTDRGTFETSTASSAVVPLPTIPVTPAPAMPAVPAPTLEPVPPTAAPTAIPTALPTVIPAPAPAAAPQTMATPVATPPPPPVPAALPTPVSSPAPTAPPPTMAPTGAPPTPAPTPSPAFCRLPPCSFVPQSADAKSAHKLPAATATPTASPHP